MVENLSIDPWQVHAFALWRLFFWKERCDPLISLKHFPGWDGGWYMWGSSPPPDPVWAAESKSGDKMEENDQGGGGD
ncbi:hypothetical protein PtA15_10A270 [Puccinia triticina]|uniref:Uncharacterized protein n=1 Tax=Puccinia triticina TaxID=208348 RepID=A0ABY7CUB3_9BASI|nr:uncharacterized protein PtA15_10A270 [Puccinia triticina]WAQ88849.1 hypothetical protein PtA15_10A270 [Puccinia triticina]